MASVKPMSAGPHWLTLKLCLRSSRMKPISGAQAAAHTLVSRYPYCVHCGRKPQ